MTAPTLNKASEKIASRETLRLCTAGSVDDGKSTFVGRLLHDTKSVLADQLASVERTSADRGFEASTCHSSSTACAPSVSRASPSTLLPLLRHRQAHLHPG